MKNQTIKLKSNFHTSEVVFLIVITCIVSLFMGYIVSDRTSKTTYSKEDDEFISKVIENYHYIKENYYKEVDEEALLRGTISGMVNSLDDPYSVFITDINSDYFNTTLNGIYNGIGIEIINNEEGNIQVVTVFSDSPAAKAGVQVHDIIMAIDQKDLLGKDKTELTSYVKESNLEQFTMKVLRKGESINLQVKRENIQIPSVSSKIFEQNGKKIGYIYIGIFSTITDSQFAQKLEELEKQEITSLIIDVRDNSGGHLATVINIASLFLEKSKIIYQTDLKGERTEFYSNGSKTKTYPIVVLQNKNSASASELLSGALKESYGATIIGETSFGKGTVQELRQEDGIEYKVTTKKWLTPNGNWIDQKGIEPDISVELDQNYFSNPSNDTDNQLQEAIRYLQQ